MPKSIAGLWKKIPITETILFECGQLFGLVKDFMLPSINRAQ